MTAPTIEEMRNVVKLPEDSAVHIENLEREYKKLYDKLAAIESQPEPVKPARWDWKRDGMSIEPKGKFINAAEYDALQSALQRAQENPYWKEEARRYACNAEYWRERAEKAEAERDKCKRIAWDWGQGVTDAETAIRQLHKLFPIDELLKEVEK